MSSALPAASKAPDTRALEEEFAYDGNPSSKARLNAILDENLDDLKLEAAAATADEDHEDLEALAQKVLEGMCIECTDQPATLVCEQCVDNYCEVCFRAQHRRGNRASHKTRALALSKELAALYGPRGDGSQVPPAESKGAPSSEPAAAPRPMIVSAVYDDKDDEMPRVQKRKDAAEAEGGAPKAGETGEGKEGERKKKKKDPFNDSSDSDSSDDDHRSYMGGGWSIFGGGYGYGYGYKRKPPVKAPPRALVSAPLVEGGEETMYTAKWFTERSKYIPLRLSLKERKYLRLLEAAMNVSEYTDKIDIISSKDKVKRIYKQLKDVCAILSGLVTAHDYKEGQDLIVNKEFKDNADFFTRIFELGRRHKIRNPEKMRDAYGKLVYLLQDSQMPEVQELLEFSCVRPLETVHKFLHERDALAVLEDPHMPIATQEIQAEGKTRAEIDRTVGQKQTSIEFIARKYASEKITYEEIRNCLLSIGDNHSYLRFNRDPCDKMILYLKALFKQDSFEPGFSLAIVGGRNGARLTHSHAMQYQYVLQSLMLWREIAHEMFKLWYLAESDLLDPANVYRLRNTGQGLNRVQGCPRVGRAMFNILSNCQRKVGSWVGSSVIHLGDHNVPNALMFIDKYNQVSRILNPIVITLGRLDELAAKPGIGDYIKNTWGGVKRLRMTILADFFRHAFDGSGADNFFDAGSCIDGRLTSAWNWCSLVDKKPYYPIFLLSGFAGFDGQF